MSLKFTGELCVMRMENDAKSEQDLTGQFKIDMRNLTNFDPSTQNSHFWNKYSKTPKGSDLRFDLLALFKNMLRIKIKKKKKI